MLQVDSSIINEDPMEEQESSIQDSSKSKCKKMQFVPDNNSEEEDEYWAFERMSYDKLKYDLLYKKDIDYLINFMKSSSN